MGSLKGTLFCMLLVVAVSRPNPITIAAGTAGKADPLPEDYRLKTIIEPDSYDLDLTLPTGFETEGKFSGIVKISVKRVDPKIPAAGEEEDDKTIWLHVDTERLTVTKNDIKLYESPSTDQNQLDITTFLEHPKVQMISVKLKNTFNLEFGKVYVLEIKYTGKLPADNMYGFYRSIYKDKNGATQTIATTQFQPTHARKAFPCLDEPQYKSTFRIKIKHPNAYHALSNAAIETTEELANSIVQTTFKRTPKMSTYLIAFLVSKYVSLSSKVDGIDNSVWSPAETIQSAIYAWSVAPTILEAMKNFTGVSYGLEKLDQVSIPDFSAGAMENWGLVTYRETALLWDPNESSARNKQRVADVVGHELAHMWFGNLVTLKWWDSTWLNEGFARYFEYHATAKAEPTWELEKQFVVEQHQTILNSDSISTSKALTAPAFSPEEVTARFSSATYSKGGSVIRMMAHFLGMDYFYANLKNYISSNKQRNVVPDDLWNALYDKSPTTPRPVLPTTLKTIMESWTTQGGFPLVTVSKNANNGLVLKQKQFVFDSPTTPSLQRWHIPISYTTSDVKNFDKTEPILWFKDAELTVPNVWKDEITWIILNIQDTAFIRVNYEESLWNGIADALNKDDFDQIDPLNRAQLVDDIMNLARINETKYEKALDFIFYLENELDYYPWYAAFNAFSYLRRRFNSESEVAKLLDIYITRLMQKYHENAVADLEKETQIQIYSKVQAQTWACLLNNEKCVNDAVEKFSQLKNGVPVDPDLRSFVYCTALRRSDNVEDWNLLWDKFTTTRVASEAATILTALGCTSNPDLLNEYLKKSIEDSAIRSQDAQSVFTAVISGSAAGVAAGFNFLKDNHAAIAKRYGGMNALSSVISGLADRLTTDAQITDLEEFINANKVELAEALEAANAAIKNARANIKWAGAFTTQLQNYLQDKVGGGGGGGSDGGSGAICISYITLIFGVIFTLVYKL